jgi:hypothetical protein
MTAAPGEAILDAIREVVEEAAGNLRTITAGTYAGELYDDLDDGTKSKRALTAPRVEATITRAMPHSATYPVTGSKRLEAIEVELMVVRHIGPKEMTSDAARSLAKGLAYADAGVLKEALSYPGNLTQTSGAVATGLVSGMLFWVRSELVRIQLGGDDRPGLIETIHEFRGTVNVAQATS